MQLLTWTSYSQSLRERFEQKLAKYEEASRRLAESHGLVLAPKKYSPPNLDWFVLYQFAGLSSPQIATRVAKADEETRIDESTVLKEIKAAARLVGWACLRPNLKRGNRKFR